MASLSPIDVVTLTQSLIAAPSVSPATGAVFDLLQSILEPLGFCVERFIDGADAPDGPVENMLAVRRPRQGAHGGRHLAFAGHVDVVPVGEGWSHDAFAPRIAGGLLYGRGAVDMKGAVAAFIAAAAATPQDAGTLSLIITGDEEGPAIHGTRSLMEHMAKRNITPDMILVGEPSSTNRLGDTMKVGRRGSVNIWITVPGREGHVAYPARADNPIPRLLRILTRIDAIVLDAGNDFFQASNIEITTIDVGNKATNVIPAKAEARLSIRFNDLQEGQALATRITALVHDEDPAATVTPLISGEAFRTRPGPWADMVAEASREVTGIACEQSTTGGTSDARFLHVLAPILEFGLVNATMHKRDEAVAIDDLNALVAIYRGVISRALAS
ncbi:MAG: succinyl-diaminopimelate desuccinylase [Sphingopyxis sp.]